MKKAIVVLFVYLSIIYIYSQTNYTKNPLHFFSKNGAFLCGYADELDTESSTNKIKTAVFMYFKIDMNEKYGVVFISDRMEIGKNDSSVFERKMRNSEGFYYIAELFDSTHFKIYFLFKKHVPYISSFNDDININKHKNIIFNSKNIFDVEYKMFELIVENNSAKIVSEYEKLLFSNDKILQSEKPFEYVTYSKYNTAFIAMQAEQLTSSDSSNDENIVANNKYLDSIETAIPVKTRANYLQYTKNKDSIYKGWVYVGTVNKKTKIVSTNFNDINNKRLIDLKAGNTFAPNTDTYIRQYSGNDSIAKKPPIIGVLKQTGIIKYKKYCIIVGKNNVKYLWVLFENN